MSLTTPIAGAGLAAILLASMARAFLGRPAPRPHRRAARALLGATAGFYLAGAAFVVAANATFPGAFLIVAGIEASCIGAWLVRGGGGDDGDDGDEDDPAPWDWDAFDRARATWGGRPRVAV